MALIRGGTTAAAFVAFVWLAQTGAMGSAADGDRVGGTRVHARHVEVTVSPEAGSPQTRFRVQFRARNRARGGWAYDIEATGPEDDSTGCNSDFQTFRHPKRGDLVVVKMPRRSESAWCPGTYKGLIFLQRDDSEGDTVVDKIVGRYTFRVGE